jgi:uncharacterized membrane protein YcaP (DUF421 family)
VFDDLWSGFSWVELADKTLRTVAVYLAILVLLRVAGKRSVGQLSTFDFVVILLLSNVVQNAIIGPDNTLVGGLAGAAILIAINFVLVFFAFLNPRFERDIRGRATTLVENGHPNRKALRRELITSAELDASLRRQGYDGARAVESAVLEPEGSLTVVPKPEPHLADVLAVLERIERKLDALPG